MANYFGAFPARYFGGGYWRGTGEVDPGLLAAFIQGSGSLAATATVTERQPAVIGLRGDDAGLPSVKEWFRKRQLREFEEALEEVATAPDVQEAVAEAIEAFAPMVAAAPSLAPVRAISAALRRLADDRVSREVAVRQIEEQFAEIKRVQKRRRDEAALLMVM
jgi:hypothetical protein